MKWLLSAGCSLALVLVACSGNPPSGTDTGQVQGLAAGLQFDFVQESDLPAQDLQAYLKQAQDYADQISRRRQIDFFKVHTNPVGLRLKQGSHQADILSFIGTALERNDLNLELRLLSGSNTNLNLNYSGPLTLSSAFSRGEQNRLASVQAASGFQFELIQGLPPESFLRPYERHLDSLARILRSRYQAQPIEFDDAPLIYAVELNQELQGFVFFNQRNILRLGERKYADLQSVAFVDLDRQVAAAYTLLGFNPKATAAVSALPYQIMPLADLGTLIQFGEL